MALNKIPYSRKNGSAYDKRFALNYKCNQSEDYFISILNPGSDNYQKGALIYNEGNLLALAKLYNDLTCVLIGDDQIYDLEKSLNDSLKFFTQKEEFHDPDFFIKNGWIRLEVLGDFVIGDRPEINVTTGLIDKHPRYFLFENMEKYIYNKSMKQINKDFKDKSPNLVYDSSINRIINLTTHLI